MRSSPWFDGSWGVASAFCAATLRWTSSVQTRISQAQGPNCLPGLRIILKLLMHGGEFVFHRFLLSGGAGRAGRLRLPGDHRQMART